LEKFCLTGIASIFLIVLSILLITSIPNLAFAVPTEFGEFQNITNCSTTNLCSAPGFGDMTNSGNNIHVLFAAEAPCTNEIVFCNGGGDARDEILVVSSNDGGQTFGSPINISNSFFDSQMLDPFVGDTDRQIASFGNNVIGVWRETDDMFDNSLFARISTDAGASFGNRITIQDFLGEVNPLYPTVAASSSGFFLAYQESGSILPGIHFCKSSFSESFNCQRIAGALENDCTFSPSSCEHVTIAASGDNVHVVWDTNAPVSDSIGNLMIRTSNNGGSSFNSKIQLSNVTTLDDEIRNISMVADGDNLYILWTELLDDNINFIASNNGGATFGDVIPITNGPLNNHPQISSSENNVYLLYEDENGDIAFRKSSNSGTSFESPVQISNCGLFNDRVGTINGKVFVTCDGTKYVESENSGLTFGSTTILFPGPDFSVSGAYSSVMSNGNKVFILDNHQPFLQPENWELILRVGQTPLAACSPPMSGDWTIIESCEILSDIVSPASVIIQNNSAVLINSEGSLTIPSGENVIIVNGSGLKLIQGSALNILS
jgi:hypothetical protein